MSVIRPSKVRAHWDIARFSESKSAQLVICIEPTLRPGSARKSEDYVQIGICARCPGWHDTQPIHCSNPYQCDSQGELAVCLPIFWEQYWI